MIDIIITTYEREKLFKKSFTSFLSNTSRDIYRLTLVVDGGTIEKNKDLIYQNVDNIIIHKKNQGLAPSINQALAYVKSLNEYFDNNQNKYICYCQDDIEYKDGWLEKLLKVHNIYQKKYKIGFISGHNAPEHETIGEVRFGKDKILLKPWIRATNMFATREYFLSMLPIPRIDPETNRERGRPNNGLGSGVDWWLIRNHPNSVCKSGRINLVIPGLVKHIGYNESTWLNRELPEDDC